MNFTGTGATLFFLTLVVVGKDMVIARFMVAAAFHICFGFLVGGVSHPSVSLEESSNGDIVYPSSLSSLLGSLSSGVV